MGFKTFSSKKYGIIILNNKTPLNQIKTTFYRVTGLIIQTHQLRYPFDYKKWIRFLEELLNIYY